MEIIDIQRQKCRDETAGPRPDGWAAVTAHRGIANGVQISDTCFRATVRRQQRSRGLGLTNAAILSASLVTLWMLFHIGCSALRMGTA